jgi:hypothetical protein
VSKELWLQEFERLYAAAEERFGKVSNATYDSLAQKADKAFADRMADRIDEARMREKEGGLTWTRN